MSFRLSRSIAALGLLLTSFAQPAGAASIPPGWLVISEVLANPSAVSDTSGEWFELTNTGYLALDLDGLFVGDERGPRHEISVPSGRLQLVPNDFLLFARNGDPARNGGVVPDYVYSGVSLGNGADTLRLFEQDEVVAELVYDTGFAVAGSSRELGRASGGVNDYVLAEAIFGAGDLGTPGAPGQFDSLAPVPLPASVWLMLGGLGALARYRRKPGHAGRGRKPSARSRRFPRRFAPQSNVCR